MRAALRPAPAESVSSLVRGLRRLNERYAEEVEALQAASDRLSPAAREELERLIQNRDRALARVNTEFQALAPESSITSQQFSTINAKIEAAHRVMDDVNLHVMANERIA